MKTKRVVKWGVIALVVFGAMALLAVLIDERTSGHEDTWQRDFGRRP